MPLYKVTVQYPYTRWYEQEIEIVAKNKAEAKVEAIKLADANVSDYYEAGDGEAGQTDAVGVDLLGPD